MKKNKSFIVTLNIMVVGIVSVTILVTSFIFFYYLYQTTGQDVINTLSKDLGQINQQLERDIQQTVDVTNNLACDVELGKAVEKFYSDNLEESVEGKRMMDYILQNAVAMNPHIVNLVITRGNEIVQYNKYGRNILEDIKEIKAQSWYDSLMRGEILQVLEVRNMKKDRKENSPYFLCATKFKSKFYEKREDENRLALVTFQLEELGNLIENTANLKNINILLFDEEAQKVVYNVGVCDSYTKMFQNWNQKDMDKLIDLGHDFIILTSQNAMNGWSLIGFVEKPIYQQMLSSVSPWVFGLVTIILIGAICLSLLIFKSISKPLKNVIKGMEDVGKQDFYSLAEAGQYKEFEQLVKTFNRMSNRIQNLITNIEEKEHEKRIEEFKALEYQINPHFIYNTLDGIRWVALMNHSKPTADILGSFANFLRMTLSEGKELVRVEKELEITKEYMKIMIFRNNVNVKIEYETLGPIKDLYTLKLVLQPVVENCFIHAFDHTIAEPTIRICCSVKEEMLLMEVIDNGKGIGKGTTLKGNQILTGIGINNIDERIKLWHGSNYGLTMKEMEGGGTIVTLRQPVIKTMEEE